MVNTKKYHRIIDMQNVFVNLTTNQYSILCIFFILLLFVMSFGSMHFDEGMWSYIGRIWCENNLPPYIGAIDNKTPGIFELFAISHILFGINYFFVRLLGVIAILFASLTVYLIGKELHTHLAGIFSMVIFGLTMTWKALDGVITSHTETFMVMFSTLSFYFVIKGTARQKWKRWVVLSGLSMGLAIAFKQIALTSTLGLLFFFIVYADNYLMNKDKLLGSILLILGIIISTLFSVMPILFSGVSLKEYIYGAWLILLNQGEGSHASSIISYIRGFFRAWLYSRIAIFHFFLFLLILKHDLVKNRYFIGLLIWMLFDFLGASASGHYYGHQIKQLVPSISIIIGILLSDLLMNYISEKSLMSKYATIMVLFLVILLFPFKSLEVCKPIQTLLGNTKSDKSKEIGIWLRDNTNKEDYVYIVGDSRILSYSDRVSSSKYFNTIFVTSTVEREQLLSDLKTKPPLYFLRLKSSIGIGEKIEGFIKDNYTLSHSKYDYEVWKRDSL